MKVSEHPLWPKFLQFHNDNPQVLTEIERRAFEFRVANPDGVLGIALIYNLMRWENLVSTVGDKYKLRNDFQPFYARVVMRKNPMLVGVFKVKKLFAKKINMAA